MSRLIQFLKPYKKECIVGPAFKVVEAILELLLPTMMALIINNGVSKGNSAYVVKMGGVMLGMAVFGFASSVVCQYYAARTSQGFGTHLRNALFDHISTFSFSEIDRFGTPTLVNRITSDVNQLQLAVAMMIRLVIRAPFICIGATIMVMILDFKLSLIFLAALPVFAVIMTLIITKASPLYTRYQQKLDRLAQVLQENLSGVRVIRAFAKKREEKARFSEGNDDLTRIAIRVGRISALMNPLTMAVMNFVILAILWTGGRHINLGTLSQGDIIAFVNYITQILLALLVVSNLVIIFTKAYASAGRVTEVLAATPAISDGNADVHPVPGAPLIEFSHVSFGYNATGDAALTDVTLSIAHGESVGVIGGTGSGKSTLINLIPRFLRRDGRLGAIGRRQRARLSPARPSGQDRLSAAKGCALFGNRGGEYPLGRRGRERRGRTEGRTDRAGGRIYPHALRMLRRARRTRRGEPLGRTEAEALHCAGAGRTARDSDSGRRHKRARLRDGRRAAQGDQAILRRHDRGHRDPEGERHHARGQDHRARRRKDIRRGYARGTDRDLRHLPRNQSVPGGG